MKNYLPSIYLALLALVLSFLFGKVLGNSLNKTETWLLLFSVFYIILARIIRKLKLKNLRMETSNRFAEFSIDDKRKFYHSTRILYIAAALIIIEYILFYFIFRDYLVSYSGVL